LIREATEAEARAIAEVHVRSWQVAYAELLPDEFLASLSVDARAEQRREQIRARHGKVWVAEEENTVIGFATAGPSRDREGVGELYAIYLLPEYVGKGIGRELMSTAESYLRHERFREAELWVLKGNERAERFYRSAGWAKDGVQKAEAFEGVMLEEERYSRRL
jgi:L-amino acid N-acyltransferase YncA